MKRILNRLLNKRGSVLFLVVVVMSLLIIAASATYYIVSNQRSSVEVRYSSEQSYQTALSMSNTVSRYINGYLNAIKRSGEKEVSKYTNTIVGKMLQGETITTKDLDLKSMGMSESEFAKVNVTIKPSGTKTVKGNTVNYFDLEVFSEHNGETTKVTQVIAIETGPADYFTRFLTSTGRRSEDVIVDANKILSGAYFENDFTRFSSAHLNDSIYVSGTFDDEGLIYNKSPYASSTEVIVTDNFYCKGASGSSIDVNKIYVGGNFYCSKLVSADEVYVLGDLEINISQSNSTVFYVNGDCRMNSGAPDQKYYINGDLYINNVSEQQGEFHVKGDVIIPSSSMTVTTKGIECGGVFRYADGSEVKPSDSGYPGWYEGWKFNHKDSYSSPLDDDKVSNAVNYITSKASKNKYQTWDAEGYFNKKFPSAETITPDDPKYAIDGAWDGYRVKIDKSCKLRPATTWSWGKHYIEIDATSSDIYIYLDSNGLKYNGKDCFMFGKDSNNINVIIKGSHSVIFVLPQNVNFKMNQFTFVGHLGLALKMTGYDSLDKLIQNENAVSTKFRPSNVSVIQNLLTSGENDSMIFDRNQLSDKSTHNNIFLITKGTDNSFDFNAESSFCGYIYAPDSTMQCDSASQTIAFIGGIIMGSYTYKNMDATLAFTTPYDYDGNYKDGDGNPVKKTDIVKELMNISAGGAPGGGSAKVFQDSYIVGYR